MTVVLAPDAPALQCLGCQIVLMTYMVVQIYNWPWKAPILNVVDMVVCFLLAILVVVAGFFAPPATGDVLEILNGFSMAVLVCLVGVVPCKRTTPSSAVGHCWHVLEHYFLDMFRYRMPCMSNIVWVVRSMIMSCGHVTCPAWNGSTPLRGWHYDFVRVASTVLSSSHRKSERAEDHDSRQHTTASRGPGGPRRPEIWSIPESIIVVQLCCNTKYIKIPVQQCAI